MFAPAGASGVVGGGGFRLVGFGVVRGWVDVVAATFDVIGDHDRFAILVGERLASFHAIRSRSFRFLSFPFVSFDILLMGFVCLLAC